MSVQKVVDLQGLNVKICSPESPRAVVQIAHGMEEHQDRYKVFVDYLLTKNLAVVTADMRGHGAKTPKEDLGWFADRDGWKLLIEDQLKIREYIGKEFPGLPVYLVAHSMGSIISRVVLQKNSSLYDKVVLTGYPNYQAAAGFGVLLANVCQTFTGSRGCSKLLNKLSTGVFNRSIESPETDFDWISYDRENITKFVEDPLCGFGFTVSAMRDLFTLVDYMHDTSRCENVNSELPFLLLSGEDDPCTGGEAGRNDSIETLKMSGFAQISVKTYPKMRHEILNEAEKKIVFSDISDFFA